MAPRRLPLAQRAEALAVIAAVHARCDFDATLAGDPLRYARACSAPEDREVAALLGALLAFGNVRTILAKLDALILDRLGGEPGRVCREASPAALRERLGGWRHRTFGGDDVAALLAAAGVLLRRHGSVYAPLARGYRDAGELRGALACWVDEVRALAWPGGLTRASRHLLPDPRGPSACKRLMLLLRWIVRREHPDLGLLPAIPPRALVIPLDVHIHRIARNLGLTARPQANWETAVEITEALRALCPEDPVRYDMAVCHLGIAQRCPSKRDAGRCEGCALQPVCRHWWKPPHGSRDLPRR